MISARKEETKKDMGRYYFNKKDTVEDCRSVSISFLKKHDYLSENSCRAGGISWKNCYGEETSSIGIVVSTFEGEKHVRFYYTVTSRSSGEKTEYDYKVHLTTTPALLVREVFIAGGGSGSSISPQGVIIMAVGIALNYLMRAGTNQGWDESVNWGIY